MVGFREPCALSTSVIPQNHSEEARVFRPLNCQIVRGNRGLQAVFVEPASVMPKKSTNTSGL
jgi:hypothetical protein